MKFIALGFSALIVAIGVLGVVSPGALLGAVESFQTPGGLYLVAGIRLAMAGALFAAAATSRAPTAVRVLGAVTLLVAVATPFFGLERAQQLVTWWSAQGAGFIRAWAACVIGLGLLLAYAVTPQRRAAI
jgi:hypothetical protein